MAIIVQKFGGTSVADVNKIHKVAKKIQETVNAGHKVVVVVSAMAGETDNLEKLAYSITDKPDPRELDVLLASGEQAAIAMLAMSLLSIGCKARSFTGSQVKIQTDPVHGKARISNVEVGKLLATLDEGLVAVVAGFQGIDSKGNITTFGRGGSDTTAVTLAAALEADECQIYTDVNGVFTTDPKVVFNASQMSEVTFEEMLELSSLGTKVLQSRAVECASHYNVPVRVLPTFGDGVGTLISYEDKEIPRRAVSGVAFNREEAKIVIRGVPDQPGYASKILEPIALANVEVDMVTKSAHAPGKADITFTLKRKDLLQIASVIDELVNSLGAEGVITDTGVAKISLVGIGMQSNPKVTSKMCKILGDRRVNIHHISASEIKVSVLVDEKYLELGVKALHSGFGL